MTSRMFLPLKRLALESHPLPKEDPMSLLSQVTQTATTPASGFGLPEVGGAAGVLTAGLYLLDKWLNYRSTGRAVASEETKEERSHIADWATKLLAADMEARKEDGADRRAVTAALRRWQATTAPVEAVPVESGLASAVEPPAVTATSVDEPQAAAERVRGAGDGGAQTLAGADSPGHLAAQAGV